MKSQYQVLRSTNTEESNPYQELQKNQHEMFIKVVDLKETMYSDQTSKSPYLSSKGMRYIMIAYHTDENCILSNPIRNKTEYQMLQT